MPITAQEQGERGRARGAASLPPGKLVSGSGAGRVLVGSTGVCSLLHP